MVIMHGEDVFVLEMRLLVDGILFLKVMDYPKFSFTEEQKREFIATLLEVVKFIKVRQRVRTIKEDPADNRVLECALAAKADYIITGDRHLLKLERYRGISTLTAKAFLSQIQL